LIGRNVSIVAATAVLAVGAGGSAFAATHHSTQRAHHAKLMRAMRAHAANQFSPAASTADCPNMGPGSSSSSTA